MRDRLPAMRSLQATHAQAVVDAFFEILGPGSGVERIMALQWRESRSLTVERHAPLMTTVGKVQHLHHERHRT